VCLRNICINSLHKGYNDDDDDDNDDDDDDDDNNNNNNNNSSKTVFPRDMLGHGDLCINTLNKGDNDNNNNNNKLTFFS